MYTKTIATFLWDIYAVIAAVKYAGTCISPEDDAHRSARFANKLFSERCKRIPVEKDK